MKKEILFFLIFSRVALCAQVPTLGLIDRWEFTGSLTSGINLIAPDNGINLPTYVNDRCNNPNAAVTFDGISEFLQYTLPTALLPQGDSARSFSFWMKTANTAYGNTSTAKALVCYGKTYFGSGGVGGSGFEINHNYCDKGIGIDMSNQAFTDSISCVDNTMWHHVAAIFPGPTPGNPNPSYITTQIWVDGNLLLSTCNITGTNQVPQTFFSPLFFGCNMEMPANRHYNGAMDDIYIYNRALTPAEVQQLFNDQCSIAGTNTFCAGSTYTYSCPMSGLSYSWSLPTGWSVSSGAGTGTIAVVSGTASGSVQVAISTGCATLTKTLPLARALECNIAEAIPEIAPEKTLFLHPNPSSAILNIQLPPGFETRSSQIEIINTLGETVYKAAYTEVLNIETIKSGLYSVKAYNNTAKASARFIKEE